MSQNTVSIRSSRSARVMRGAILLLLALCWPNLAAAFPAVSLVAWSTQDALDGPFHANTLEQRADWNAEIARPCGYRLSLSVEGQLTLISHVFNARSQRIFNGPSEPKSAVERTNGHVTTEASPFSYGEPATAKRQEFIVSFVAGLLEPRGPSAILRRVGAVVINTFDAVSLGLARTHVSQERIKRFRPLIADRDSSPAVILVGRTRWVQDARFHFEPDTALANVGLWHV